MVTDYDCWRDDRAAVDVAEVVAQMAANGRIARAAVAHLLRHLPPARTPSPIDTALDGAIMTAPAQRDAALIRRNAAIVARVFG
jgi:5'-methylthioadenosine phosphorylase